MNDLLHHQCSAVLCSWRKWLCFTTFTTRISALTCLPPVYFRLFAPISICLSGSRHQRISALGAVRLCAMQIYYWHWQWHLSLGLPPVPNPKPVTSRLVSDSAANICTKSPSFNRSTQKLACKSKEHQNESTASRVYRWAVILSTGELAGMNEWTQAQACLMPHQQHWLMIYVWSNDTLARRCCLPLAHHFNLTPLTHVPEICALHGANFLHVNHADATAVIRVFTVTLRSSSYRIFQYQFLAPDIIKIMIIRLFYAQCHVP